MTEMIYNRVWLLTIVVGVTAMAGIAAAQPTTSPFVESMDKAQEIASGEKPILLDFYTDW